MRQKLGILTVAALGIFLMGAKAPSGIEELEIGKKAPAFSLPATDGKTYSYADLAGDKGTLVVFTCNHCPYAVAYQDRIIALAEKRKAQGIRVVAISCNDARIFPGDSFDEMKRRAKKKEYNFPYLYDATQEIALQYGPKVTPHVFLFDSTRTLIYRGRIDDSTREKSVKERDLDAAIDAYLASQKIPTAETTAFGCSIKWRPEVASFKADDES